MKKTLFLILIIVASAVIVRSFFMPWARVKTSVTKVAQGVADQADKTIGDTRLGGKVIKDLQKVTGTIGQFGDIQVKSTVRGYEIPKLVNNKTSKVALSLSQVLFNKGGDVGKKSYLVYLLPILALVCSVLAVIGLNYIWSIIIMVVISGGISFTGLYHLTKMDISNLYVEIEILKPLWNTMYAYLFIFIVGAIWVIAEKIQRKT